METSRLMSASLRVAARRLGRIHEPQCMRHPRLGKKGSHRAGLTESTEKRRRELGHGLRETGYGTGGSGCRLVTRRSPLHFPSSGFGPVSRVPYPGSSAPRPSPLATVSWLPAASSRERAKKNLHASPRGEADGHEPAGEGSLPRLYPNKGGVDLPVRASTARKSRTRTRGARTCATRLSPKEPALSNAKGAK
jgi:hypothetical protein